MQHSNTLIFGSGLCSNVSAPEPWIGHAAVVPARWIETRGGLVSITDMLGELVKPFEICYFLGHFGTLDISFNSIPILEAFRNPSYNVKRPHRGK